MEHDAVDGILEQWHLERPDLDVTAMGVMGRLARASRVAQVDLQKLMSQFDLEPWEFDVLATLRRSTAEAPLTAGQLAAMTMVGSAATTHRVDRLVERGLVQRAVNPDNRRQLLISLTPEGEALIDKVVGHHVANQHRMLAGLTPGEIDTFADLLRKFLLSHGDQQVRRRPADI